MAMDMATHTAMAIPMVTDTGMVQGTMAMARATMATGTTGTATTVATGIMVIDQTLSVSSNNWLVPDTTAVPSTE